jgi:hypothetical protein
MVLVVALLAAVVGGGAASAQELAARLAADEAVVYARIDTGNLVEQARRSLLFVDEEIGRTMVEHVRELYSAGREMAGRYEFDPVVFDRVGETQAHFVVMAAEGEGEAELEYVMSLVLETPDDATAEDLMREARELAEFLREAGESGAEIVEIEVDDGQMIGVEDVEATLGQFGRFVVLSSDKPTALWGALTTAAANPVSEAPLYARLTGGDITPAFVVLVNLRAFLDLTEGSMLGGLREAEKAMEAGEGSEQGIFGPEFQLRVLRAAHKRYRTMAELFSLDQLQAVGGASAWRTTDSRSVQHGVALLSHGEPLSPLMQELLSGSGSFSLPSAVENDRLCIMARVSPAVVHRELATALAELAADPDTAQMGMRLGMLTAVLPPGLGGVIQLLDSDFYISVDVAEKEVTTREFTGWDEESGEPLFETSTGMATVPDVTVLCGVADPAAMGVQLDGMLTTMAADPGTFFEARKRVYQDTDVYCLMSPGSGPEDYPDGLTGIALVVAGRYLTLGGWDYVTGVIRQMAPGATTGGGELAAIAERHEAANFIAIMPKAFQQKLQDLQDEKVMAEMFDELLEEIEQGDLTMEDEELEQRLRSAVAGLIAGFQEYMAKQSDRLPETTVLTGSHEGQFYELSSTVEVVK